MSIPSARSPSRFVRRCPIHRRSRVGVLIALAALLACGARARAVTIPTVPVGNPGNAPDQLYTDHNPNSLQFGAVAYEYRMGKYEVTNSEYAEFLNAKAASDPLLLYHRLNPTTSESGIARSGSDGSYTYSVIPGRGDKPVIFVSWFAALRFINWLHNGQGDGDTETGAYTLLGGTPEPSNSLSITRNAGATWFLPNEDEWHKAAYFDPSSAAYFDYPTASNTAPIAEEPPGGSNSANYDFFGVASADVTDVGAYTSSVSPYGTYDQAGNAWEWIEGYNDDTGHPSLLGGGFVDNVDILKSSFRDWGYTPYQSGNEYGSFRVATVAIVPEPSTAVLAGMGVAALLILAAHRFWQARGRPGAARLFLLCAISLVVPAATHAVTIPTVPVGNAGNAGDAQSQGIFGSVAYDYRIGTTEVTNAQYVDFLNAVAATDTYGLYNTSMGSGFGGITRSGASGGYTYATVTGREIMPVNYVSWYDAIRFANWLHNGQGSGDTESGAYTLLGGTPTPSNGLSITRNSGATWFLTSEDEWYKAAYYDPSGSSYFDYPTSSNTAPVAEAPAGGSNSANINGAVGDLTDVGAYTGSVSPYGTFDQGGNVWEWNEDLSNISYRIARGGFFDAHSGYTAASNRNPFLVPTFESDGFGFRVATVPEPSTLLLAVLGTIVLVAWRRPRRSPRRMSRLTAART